MNPHRHQLTGEQDKTVMPVAPPENCDLSCRMKPGCPATHKEK